MGFTRGVSRGVVSSLWSQDIGGPSVSYTVFWDMTADGLDTYNATDGSTTDTSGLTYTAEGAEFNAASDHARFTCTHGNSINKDEWEIGFKYKKVGTVGAYAPFLEHNFSTKAIALIRDGSSNNQFRAYVNNQYRLMVSTVSNFYDGTEHSLVLTFNNASNALTLSVDGEAPVSMSTGYATPTITSGLMGVGNGFTETISCMGIMSDFYIL